MSEKFISPCPPPCPYDRELLTILMEECAEAAQRASKIIRFGAQEIQPGQNMTNVERMSEELGDILGTINVLTKRGLTDYQIIADATARKPAKIEKFIQSTPE